MDTKMRGKRATGVIAEDLKTAFAVMRSCGAHIAHTLPRRFRCECNESRSGWRTSH